MNKLSEKERENALNEVRILASIRSPQVLGYRDSFFEAESNTLCLVIEYAD
jgi:NIMA (never in mitosis gene a)-related kinase